MEFTGRYIIPTSPEAVWAALNDPEILKACIPGCEQMDKTDATHFAVATRLKIGPLKATFRGRIELSEMDPPKRCVLKGEGQGGVAGFARGDAEVLLAPESGGTVLSYTAKAAMGGKLAQIGQRLIDGAAKQIADNFFSRFAAVLTATPAGPGGAILDEFAPSLASEVAAPPLIEGAPPDGESPVREGVAPEIWVIGLIGVIVILLVLFGLVL
jgi:hypothetical protein